MLAGGTVFSRMILALTVAQELDRRCQWRSDSLLTVGWPARLRQRLVPTRDSSKVNKTKRPAIALVLVRPEFFAARREVSPAFQLLYQPQ